jgi:glutathione S-transferase
MQLVIGNKNYSSWSMRAWVLMRQAGIAFDEVQLRFGGGFASGSPFKRAIAAYSPAGKFPDKRLWPDAPGERARARSACAEMHAGFTALRTHCPMNIEARLPEVGARLLAEREDVRADLARVEGLWCGLLAAHGGPLLFGRFTIADAFFAPVCSRIRTYGLPLTPAAEAYVEEVHALPAVQAWVADALADHDFLDFEEPYRTSR